MKPSRLMADVSSNNGAISIPSYSRAGHVLIAIKATEGTHYTNPFHIGQSDRAHDYGLTVLHYHFCDQLKNIPGEIDHFREQYNKAWRPGDYCCFDIEVPGWDQNSANTLLRDFAHKTAHEPIVYSDYSYFQSNLNGIVFPGNRVWIAAYQLNQPKLSKIYNVVAWQYTDGKSGPGPKFYSGVGKCDGSIISIGMATRLAVRKIRTRKDK